MFGTKLYSDLRIHVYKIAFSKTKTTTDFTLFEDSIPILQYKRERSVLISPLTSTIS